MLLGSRSPILRCIIKSNVENQLSKESLNPLFRGIP